jgi:hypothetical protein
MTSTKEQLTRRFAAVAIALVGVIHLVLAPEQIKAEAYVGVLFIVGGLAALVVAARLWMTSDRFAWTLGVLVSVGMFVGFILSRTTGLPGFKESEWELSGIFCLILEAGFVGAFLSARRARPLATTRSAAPRQAGPRRRGAPEAARQVW